MTEGPRLSRPCPQLQQYPHPEPQLLPPVDWRLGAGCSIAPRKEVRRKICERGGHAPEPVPR